VRAWAWVVLLAACNGDKDGTDTGATDADTDTDTDTDVDTDTDADTDSGLTGTGETGLTGPTGDTAVGVAPAQLRVEYFLPSAIFGYDNASGSLVDVQSAYGVYEPAILLEFGTYDWYDSGFDPSRTDEYCTIELPLTSSVDAPWATSDPTVWYGVDYVEGMAGVQTDCDTVGKQFDPALFGDDAVATIVDTYGAWGVGIGEFDPVWYSLYDPATTDVLSAFVGARLYTAGGFLDPTPFAASPIQIDPVTYTVLTDPTGAYLLTVPPADVPMGDTVATAVYSVFSLYVYIL
jgi:hypothetical protein